MSYFWEIILKIVISHMIISFVPTF